MRRKFLYLPLFLLIVGMVGCNNEEELVTENGSLKNKCDKVEVVFENSEEGSRAMLQDNGSIFWEKGDQINVYVEHGDGYYDKNENEFIYENTEKLWVTYHAKTGGSGTGVFESEITYPDIPEYKWEKQLAFYGIKNESWNALSFVTWDEESQKINFSIDASPENPFVMASLLEKDSQDNFKLYNAGAIVKVDINNMPDDTRYYMLELEAGGDDHYREYGLWGDCEIAFDDEGKPVWTVLPSEWGGYNSLIGQMLREGDDPLVGECKSTFYFTIPPADYLGGLTLTLRGASYDEEGNPLSDYTLGTLKDESGGLKVNRNDYILMSFDYVDYVDATTDNISTAFQKSNYVRLYDDVKLTSDLILDKVGEEMILDLNGNTLIIADGTSLVNKANLKIRNGKISPGSSKVNIMNDGDISLFNVMFELYTDGCADKPSYALYNRGKAFLGGIGSGAYHIAEGFVNEGEMTIAKGDYYTGSEYCIYNQNSGANLIIRDGHIEGWNGILTSNGAKTIVYNANVKGNKAGDSYAMALMGTTSNVVIEDGVFESLGMNCIYNANTDKASFLDDRIVIKGGKFSSDKYEAYGVEKWEWINERYCIPILK